MMMRRVFKYFMLLLALFQSPDFFAQKDRDRIEALRVAFISKRVELTPAESEKFWPVYNEYNDKIKAIRKNLRQSYRKSPDAISDAEAEELYRLDLQSKQAETEVHKQYGEKIKG